MRKILLVGILALFSLSTVAGAITADEITITKNDEVNEIEEVSADFTHTTFVEYATTTWCPPCAQASEDLFTIYESGDYPFYYVSLISDVNSIAGKRMGSLGVYSIPALYFDSGYEIVIGAVGETQYRTVMEETGMREVKQPLDMTTSVSWDGNAKITVTVTVTNNGNFFYFGILRSYVTEIVSRWDNYAGDPYHFGFLDFAIKKLVFIPKGQTKSYTATFDGKADHGGQTFEDITQENIMVISTVSHWIPKLKFSETGVPYITFYVDQTSGGTPI